ncbi:hypothetical protein [Fluviicola sp.]|jgi:hypothetical protein|uniref:hypothetical protein n=1 Tax=Fluviicola sp. TaxID=1917219 RepID=UPI0028177761|nr:hypothetical protein [Fluviicola sp.]MDR0802995.1 hypothetical protein [Fluviicola sp.]
MRETTFTEKQINLLQELLKTRLVYCNEFIDSNNKRDYNFYVKPLVSAFYKMPTLEVAFYDSKEKTAFISCVNEYLHKHSAEITIKTAHSWLTISDEQRGLCEKLDDCEEILRKCGYFKKNRSLMYNKDFRFGKILATIEKLKNSDKIFLSKSGDNNYYKIAFVYDNKEYLPFELKFGTYHIHNFDSEFISLNGELPEKIGAKNFSLVTTKSDAKKMLASCDKQYYSEGALDFINVLLD